MDKVVWSLLLTLGQAVEELPPIPLARQGEEPGFELLAVAAGRPGRDGVATTATGSGP
ncbi:MAG: hypothetical protein ACYTGH_06595 [Planctomycetota bacterium]